MKPTHAFLAALLLAPSMAIGAEATPAAPILLGGSQQTWSDIPGIRGGKESKLYANPKTGEDVRIVRWPFNTELKEQAFAADTHIFIHAGTFTLTIGELYREFGIGDYVMIPRGVKHILGCEASGTCVLVVHTTVPPK
jgi:quercetin dioxygenase-like cupin family protein